MAIYVSLFYKTYMLQIHSLHALRITLFTAFSNRFTASDNRAILVAVQTQFVCWFLFALK